MPWDAVLLKECLDKDPRDMNSIVKVFRGRWHGFAHAGLWAGGEGDGNRNRSERLPREEPPRGGECPNVPSPRATAVALGKLALSAAPPRPAASPRDVTNVPSGEFSGVPSPRTVAVALRT